MPSLVKAVHHGGKRVFARPDEAFRTRADAAGRLVIDSPVASRTSRARRPIEGAAASLLPSARGRFRPVDVIAPLALAGVGPDVEGADDGVVAEGAIGAAEAGHPVVALGPVGLELVADADAAHRRLTPPRGPSFSGNFHKGSQRGINRLTVREEVRNIRVNYDNI